MTVTFPHMGPLGLVLNQFFCYLDIPCVVPPDNSRDALEKGIAVSPEEICLPFKYMAGNYIEAYEKGADTALMIATCGPCRLGEYGELLKQVVQKAGCSYDWVLLDTPGAVGGKEFLRRCGMLTGNESIRKKDVAGGIRSGLDLLVRIDRLRAKASKTAGYLEKPYDAVRILHETERHLKYAGNFSECISIIKAMECRLKKLPRNSDAAPVKVLVAGEIYTSIEPEANGRLEEKLMKLGCSVTRHLDLTWWMKHSFSEVFAGGPLNNFHKGNMPIPCSVGGYGRETAAKIESADDFDGVIKVMPSGCMPEIVTKAFCEKLQEKEGRRILHLIYDEMSGTAGYDTRIEAFVDMLERRRNVLAGD